MAFDNRITGADVLKVASDEFMARLQARNRIILTFSTVACTLIGVSAAEKGFAFTGVGVGFLSLAANLLNLHHELTMAHLIAFQKEVLEKCGVPPEYTWFQVKEGDLEDARNIRDLAQGIIHFILCSAALSIAGFREFTDETKPPWLHNLKLMLLGTSMFCAVVSMFVVWYTRSRRERYSRAK